ncbi:MAG: hypothetical protein LBO05_03085 [Deltaproteobacteria bacterium]|jgi:transcriptional regulator with XRE-family HTH domain|nr:hypothetical protein [Deltaproteobacteria bacterium]
MKQPNPNHRHGPAEFEARAPRQASLPSVTAEEVRKIRKTLALTVDYFALLLGVSPSSVFRYENVGSHVYHQGPVARKLCLLSFWLREDGFVAAVKNILAGGGGLAVLAGLLETGNVLSHRVLMETRTAGAGAGEDPEAAAELVLPAVDDLAGLILKAFCQDEPPILSQPAAEPAPPAPADREGRAAEVEFEARIMEAEARKLEAQVRKLEAQARLNQAQQKLV